VLTDVIRVGLRLPGLIVLGEQESDGLIEVATAIAAEEAICPRCQQATGHVHQWQRQRKRDAALWGKPVWIVLLKRRFRCQGCRYVFTEDDPACGRRRRTTYRLRRQVAMESQETPVRTVARRHGVSEGLVQRSWLEATVPAPAVSSHVLVGLDGFSVRRPAIMWSGLWDLQSRRAIAVAPGQRRQDIEGLLKQLDPLAVKAVAVDLWRPNRSAVRKVLPQAAVVADKFHVIALANRALHAVRGYGQRRRPGTVAWTLHRNVERLSAGEQAQLAAALKQDETLRQAWLLKEYLRGVYEARDAGQAQVLLDRWLQDAAASGLPPFQQTTRTLKDWRQEVLNYWQYNITNAMVEGKHNRVKVLKRRAYGYRNDNTFRLRILNLNHT
jgi:transposase